MSNEEVKISRTSNLLTAVVAAFGLTSAAFVMYGGEPLPPQEAAIKLDSPAKVASLVMPSATAATEVSGASEKAALPPVVKVAREPVMTPAQTLAVAPSPAPQTVVAVKATREEVAPAAVEHSTKKSRKEAAKEAREAARKAARAEQRVAAAPAVAPVAEPSPVPAAPAAVRVPKGASPVVVAAQGDKAWVRISDTKTIIVNKGQNVPGLGTFRGTNNGNVQFD